MVFKTTVLISRLTSSSRFGKWCFLARDIHKKVKWKNMKKLKELEISLAKKHRFPNRKKLVNREIETVVLMYINPINSKKSVTSFSWIFHFWLIDFSKKIFEIKKSFRHQPWSFSLTSLHSQSKNLITEATKRSYRVDLSTIRPLY